MTGKITNDGRDHIADLVQIGIDVAGSPTNALGYIEIGTGVADVSISGVTDIAVDGVERSYNSSSTDFVAAGVTVGMIITVSGFTDANNNGSFEVLSVATNAILIKGNTTLVTEAAGDTIAISGYVVTETDSGVKTPIATGGRKAADSGWPKVVESGTDRTYQIKATFTAGSFTTGTAFTEAVWTNTGGTVTGGRIILDQSKNPSVSEPLEITLNFPLTAA